MPAKRPWQILKLPKPPSVNAMYGNNTRRPGRGRFKTKAYRAWEQEADLALMQNRLTPVTGAYELTILLGKRKGSDLGNFEKAMSDWLQSRGIVENDSLCAKLTIDWGDTLTAREAEVHIRAAASGGKPAPVRVKRVAPAVNAVDFGSDEVRLLNGDVFAMLATLPDNCIDCVVTSPPYWGLRDYGVSGQLGLEPTLGEHLQAMTRVFEEVRRVLRPSGTLWLNYGDCYAAAPNGRSAVATKAVSADDRTFRDKPFSTTGPVYSGQHEIFPAGGRRGGGDNPSGAVYIPDYEKTSRVGTGATNMGSVAAAHGGRVVAGGYLKPGDLCMVPNRLAIALQDAGWWVKSENIWGKTNPMPDSSGSSRPSTAHEKIWLMAKGNKSDWFRARDTGELRLNPDRSEMCVMVTTGKLGPRWIRMPYYYNAAAVKCPGTGYSKAPDGWDTGPGGHGSVHRNGRQAGAKIDKQRGHSRRHAGFNDRWDAMEKGEQQANGRLMRNFEPAPLGVWPMATEAFSEAHFATFPPQLAERCIMAGCPPGGVVLDPFGGAGTVGLVAARLQRKAVLIELNPEYCDLISNRLKRGFVHGLPDASPPPATRRSSADYVDLEEWIANAR